MLKISRNGNTTTIAATKPETETDTVSIWNVVVFAIYIVAAIVFTGLGAYTQFWPFTAVGVVCLITAWCYGWDTFE